MTNIKSTKAEAEAKAKAEAEAKAKAEAEAKAKAEAEVGFTFLGYDDVEVVDVRDVTFAKGEIVPVADTALASKLRNMPQFEEVK